MKVDSTTESEDEDDDEKGQGKAPRPKALLQRGRRSMSASQNRSPGDVFSDSSDDSDDENLKKINGEEKTKSLQGKVGTKTVKSPTVSPKKNGALQLLAVAKAATEAASKIVAFQSGTEETSSDDNDEDDDDAEASITAQAPVHDSHHHHHHQSPSDHRRQHEHQGDPPLAGIKKGAELPAASKTGLSKNGPPVGTEGETNLIDVDNDDEQGTPKKKHKKDGLLDKKDQAMVDNGQKIPGAVFSKGSASNPPSPPPIVKKTPPRKKPTDQVEQDSSEHEDKQDGNREEPPADLTASQKMTWFARQGRKRKAKERAELQAQVKPDSVLSARKKSELNGLVVHHMLPGETMEEYASRCANQKNMLSISGGRIKKPKRIQEEQAKLQKGKNLKSPKAKLTTNVASKNSSEALEPATPAYREVSVGTRVYCEFPIDKLWYWGNITRRFKPKFSHFFKYDVLFDDGDKAESVSATKMVTKEEWDKMNLVSKRPEVCKSKQEVEIVKVQKAKKAQESKSDTGKPKSKIQKCQVSKKDKKDGGRFSPRELWKKRCQKCNNCLKPECSRCFCCRENKKPENMGANKLCCFQKMCEAINVESKAQDALCGFPKGWTFVFDVSMIHSNYKDLHLNGLLIFPPPPNTRKYCFLHTAKNHNPIALSKVDDAEFYAYVGLDGLSKEVNGKRRYGIDNGAKNGQLMKKSRQEVQLDRKQKEMLAALYEDRCQQCPLCVRPTCEKCTACKENKTANNDEQVQKLVCYQKMCCQLDPEFKKQAAPGLPAGWKFYYMDPQDVTWKNDEVPCGLAGLILLSPNGQKFPTVENAAASLVESGNITDMAATFYTHVGCTVEPRHPLLDKTFRQRWIDVEGKTQVIYGRIAQVIPCHDGKHYTVEFFPESRALVNSSLSSSRGLVPERHRVCEPFAFGGCFDVNPNIVQACQIDHYCTWHVPDFRHQALDRGDNGNFLPELTVHFRGFQLVMKPKQSTIPNAGYGVFVSCTNLLGTGGSLTLKKGELLDLGVYAPFRPEDLKHKHVFDLKNFLFSSICGEWTFDTTKGDTQLFDITDDATGELHALAKRHIPAYVNETDGKSAPSITAQHDPAGSVHYLLGHYDEIYGGLVIQADGVSREVFIDYGKSYEDFRIRKNYSRLPKKEAEAQLKELLENDHILEMDELRKMNIAEITDCLEFMTTHWYDPNREYAVPVVTRGLLALMLLRKRMDELMEECGPDPLRRGNCANELGPCGSILLQRSKANTFIYCLFGWWNDCYKLKETFMSDKILKKALAFILGPDTDLERMPPDILENKIKGTEIPGSSYLSGHGYAHGYYV